MNNPYQYAQDLKNKETKHDWFFEFAGCECGPFHGRDNTRVMLKKFKKDYVSLLKKYHGGSSLYQIFTD